MILKNLPTLRPKELAISVIGATGKNPELVLRWRLGLNRDMGQPTLRPKELAISAIGATGKGTVLVLGWGLVVWSGDRGQF